MVLLDCVVSPSQSSEFWEIFGSSESNQDLYFSPHCGQRWHPAAKMSQNVITHKSDWHDQGVLRLLKVGVVLRWQKAPGLI